MIEKEVQVHSEEEVFKIFDTFFKTKIDEEVWESLNIEYYCLQHLFERVEFSRETRGFQKIRLKSSFKSQGA